MAQFTTTKLDRVWKKSGLNDFPELTLEVPYREEREQIRFQADLLKGWAAYQLEDFQAAIDAFHAALDRCETESKLNKWVLRHLLECKSDYLDEPINGAWPGRSLRFDSESPGNLMEVTLPRKNQEAHYDEKTESALHLIHRLLLLPPHEMQQAAAVYYTYHPVVDAKAGMVLAPIRQGSFQMGSPEDEPGRYNDEVLHQVTLSHPFWIGIYPVTQKQYHSVMGDNPSEFETPDCPVENVSWEDAHSFCQKMNDDPSVQIPDGYVFRLPTEAEWEYCCRAGTETMYCFGNEEKELGEHAWFDGNSDEHTQVVGLKKPNAWGLFDMHGNVWEWCLDAADRDDSYDVVTDTYTAGAIDPICKVGGNRVRRGGGWNCDGGVAVLRTALRSSRAFAIRT